MQEFCMYMMAFQEFGWEEQVTWAEKKRRSFRDVGNLPHDDVASFSLGEDGLDLGGVACAFLRLVVFAVPCRENLHSECNGKEQAPNWYHPYES